MSPASGRTLLAVHAHPDDESITTGGTLARYAAEGVRTVVVTCTNGDLGEVRDGSESSTTSLADRRVAELWAACGILGVSRLEVLGYRDSGMAGWPQNQAPEAFLQAPLAAAAERVAQVIREERPQVVLTYDAIGNYGHPDHQQAHRVTRLAIASAANRWQVPALYYVVFPRTQAQDFTRTLLELGVDAPISAMAGADAGPDGDQFGVADNLVSARVDVSDYAATKWAALRKHTTQMTDHWFARTPEDMLLNLWRYEYFQREGATPGGPISNDLFAGLA
jgi:N-acetyl-1-D-myo-inositol-2-amino-2-deoxy-alpha-D-glucopyranoside deacetylase